MPLVRVRVCIRGGDVLGAEPAPLPRVPGMNVFTKVALRNGPLLADVNTHPFGMISVTPNQLWAVLAPEYIRACFHVHTALSARTPHAHTGHLKRWTCWQLRRGSSAFLE